MLLEKYKSSSVVKKEDVTVIIECIYNLVNFKLSFIFIACIHCESIPLLKPHKVYWRNKPALHVLNTHALRARNGSHPRRPNSKSENGLEIRCRTYGKSE